MKITHTILFSGIAILAMQTAATASTSNRGEQPPQCYTVYVSPDSTIADDSNPGTSKQPFYNVQYAIDVASYNTPSVVVLLPGIYSNSTNASLPIHLYEDVSLQGTSAMNTIIDGEDYYSDLLWFYGAWGTFTETYVDSITFRRGDYAIYIYSELDEIGPTVSNCVITDNNHGVHIGTEWDEPDAYIHTFPKFVNNTIVENNIGVYDIAVGGPLDGFGIANTAIINCTILFNTQWDLAGVDAGDIESSAFVTMKMNQLNGLAPNSWAWTSSLTLDGTFVNAADGDYRLLPYTLLEDIGTTHLDVPNGTVVSQFSACGMNIFDFDGEGFGNPRNRGGIDIGADERDDLIIARYIPSTTTFGTDSTGHAYTLMDLNVSPKTTIGSTINVRLIASLGAESWDDTSPYPGARADGTVSLFGTANWGSLWIDRFGLTRTHGILANSGSWFSLPSPASGNPMHFNTQGVAGNANGRTELFNLQTYLAK